MAEATGTRWPIRTGIYPVCSRHLSSQKNIINITSRYNYYSNINIINNTRVYILYIIIYYAYYEGC